jgi:hypothetical protein
MIIDGELDAAELFRNTPEFKSSGGCSGSQFTKSVYNFISENATGTNKNPCPNTWSHERCTNARQILGTYAMDFNWSEAQQLAGLDFATKNCHPYQNGETLEFSSCKDLQKLKNNSSPQNTSRESRGIQ